MADDLSALSEGISQPTETAPAAPQQVADNYVPPWRQQEQSTPEETEAPSQAPTQAAPYVPPWRQQEQQKEGNKQPQGHWSDTIREGTSTAYALSPLGWGKALGDYWTGQNTPAAAVAHGAQSMVLGNLPETMFELGKGALHSYLGIGDKTADQQAKLDDQYTAQLAAQHPAATWAGRILGLVGLMGAAEVGTAAAASKVPQLTSTLGGKIAWSSLISGGQGAFSGFGSSRNFQERVEGAKNQAIFGGLLGGIGGAIGGGIDKLVGKAGATSEATQAAEHLGLEPHVPLSGQTEEYGHALSKTLPESTMSQADVGQSIKDKAVDLLHLAGTKEATLSADGVKSIAANLAPILKSNNVDVGAHISKMSPGAQKSWQAIEELAMDAATNPTGKVGLDQVATYGRLINSFGREQDPGGYYNAIRGAYNKWMQDALHSNMFSGDPSAVQDYEKFKAIYPIGAQLDSNSAIAKIFDHHMNANDVANWVTNSAKVGQVNSSVQLLKTMKALVNENSPEWQSLQSLMFRNVAAPSGGPGPKLAQTLSNFTKTPIAQTLYSKPQLENMNQLSAALSGLPKTAPRAGGHGHLVEGLSGTVLGYEGAKTGWEHGEGEEWTDRLWHAVLGGFGGFAAGAMGAHVMPMTKSLAFQALSHPGASAVAKYGAPFAANKAMAPMHWPLARGGQPTVMNAGNGKKQTDNIKNGQQAASVNQNIAASDGRYRQPKSPQPPSVNHEDENNHKGVQQKRHGIHDNSPSVLRALNVARQYRQEGGAAPDLSDPMVGQAPDTMKQMHAPDWSKFGGTNMGQTVQAMALPHDVYQGQVDPTSDEAIGKAFTLVSKYRR